MSTIRRLWIPVLLAALVAMALGSAVGAGAQARTVVTRTMMIPAAAAIPAEPISDYSLQYNWAWVTGDGHFTIPLSFPAQVVTIKRITLYAYDNQAFESASLWLIRTYPPDGSRIFLGSVKTADITDDPQLVTTTAISPRRVNTGRYGLHLMVYLYGDMKFYGAKILYSYDA